MSRTEIPRVQGFPKGIKGCYRSVIWQKDYCTDTKGLYLSCYDDQGVRKTASLTIEDGKLKWVERNNGEQSVPLFEISENIDVDVIFTALAEGLHQAGYYPEVDNRERITAQALSEERKEQVDYLRKQQEKVVDKLLEVK